MALLRFNKLKRRVRNLLPRPAAALAFQDCRFIQERKFTDTGLARLDAARRDITSQNGEDGVIAAIFETIGVETRTCVEFGAWDGKHLSNTWTLIENEGWRGVLIEADPARHAGLRKAYSDPDRNSYICGFVGLDGDQRLDAMLAHTDLPRSFDLLSIDVDSIDWHILNSLSEYQPRLIVIEYNPAIPNDVSFVQASVAGISQGSSLRAIRDLARRKGYELVFATDSNAFLIERALFPKLGITNNDLDAINPANPHLFAAFELFDGTIVVAGRDRTIWQSGTLKSALRRAVVRAS